MNNIKNIWLSQETKSWGQKKIVLESIDNLDFLNCYIGYVPATETKIFQLEIGKKTILDPHYLKKFKGIEIQILPTEKDYNLFTIILLEKELTDIFILFIEDILDKLRKIDDSNTALKVINNRVQFWKRLFGKVSGEFLSIEQQRGLLGELIFLKKLLEITQDKLGTVNSWMGPHRANQDFAYNSNAVEIKTSIAGSPKVYISNEHQLDYHDWTKLILVIISLHRSSGSADTLASIIQEIILLLTDQKSLELFTSKLTLAGIPEEMILEYHDLKYSMREIYSFEVKEGFPLLIPSMLYDQSVFNVKYEIDIHQCKNFSINESEVYKIFYEHNNK